MPTIRPYTPADKPTLMELFKLNTPRYFHPSELQLFSNYLDNEVEDFFVVESDGVIRGAGGVNYHNSTGMLSWGLIHPDYHGMGMGSLLTRHRIAFLKSNPSVKEIITRTSQHTFGFYEKMGFELLKTEKDFWGNGFDLYYMKMKTQS